MVLRTKDVIPRIPAGTEIGTTGLHEFDGIIHEEILRRLQWPLGNKIWREMSDNDSVVGAILFAVEMLIRGVTWTVESADENDPVSNERADFVDSMRDDMEKPWSEVINDILSFLPFGFSVNELVYARGTRTEPAHHRSRDRRDLPGD